MYKAEANQKLGVFVYNKNTGEAKTGDASNITAMISKDAGASAALADTNPTELDATNHPGWYIFDMTELETTADMVIVTASSSTTDIVADPVVLYLEPKLSDGGGSDGVTYVTIDNLYDYLADIWSTTYGLTYTDDQYVRADVKQIDGSTAGAQCYKAQVFMNRDEPNTREEITVVWYKNGVPQTTGVTLGTIGAINRDDGTELIADDTAMTQVGSTAYWRYNLSGDERISSGDSAIITVGATIDGSERTDVVVRGLGA